MTTPTSHRPKHHAVCALAAGCATLSAGWAGAQTIGNASGAAPPTSTTNSGTPPALVPPVTPRVGPAPAVGPKTVPALPDSTRRRTDTPLPDNSRPSAAVESNSPATQQAIEGLKARSATSNIVFGRIVDVDEHRLNIRSGEELTGLQMTPHTVIQINGKTGQLSDLSDLGPEDQVHVLRNLDEPGVVDRIIVGETAVEPAARAGTSLTPPLADRRGVETIGSRVARAAEAPEVETTRHVPAGVTPVAGVDAAPLDIGLQVKPSREGAVVTAVAPGTMAANSGFLPQDLIEAFDGQSIADAGDLRHVLRTHQAGDKIEVRIVREGSPHRLTMLLPDDFQPPAVIGSEGSTPPAATPTQVVTNPDAGTAPSMNLGWQLRQTAAGVLLLQVAGGGPADVAKLQAGDLITGVNDRLVTTPTEVFRELQRHSANTTVAITVLRDDQTLTERLRLPVSQAGALAPAESPQDQTGPAPAPVNLAQLAAVQQEQLQAIQALRDELRSLRNELDGLKNQAVPAPAETPPPANR